MPTQPSREIFPNSAALKKKKKELKLAASRTTTEPTVANTSSGRSES